MAIEELTNYSRNKGMPIIGESVDIHIYARDRRGNRYDLSSATKIYCTLKDDLSALDAAADLQINSSSNPSYFNLTNAAAGEIIVTLPSTMTDDLTAGTLYYVDVKAIFSGAQRYILRLAEMRFAQWVTRSTS